MEQENKTVEEQRESTTKLPKAGIPVKTVVLIVLLAIVAAGLLFFAISAKNNTLQKLSTTKFEEVKNPADTTLLIEPATQDQESSKYSSDVSIDTGSNSVNSAQIELSYDPSILVSVDINPSGFFPSSVVLLKNIDTVNGRITFALGLPLGQSEVNGKGILAKITYSVLNPQSVNTTLSFLPKTEVRGPTATSSLLKTTKDGEITIIAPTFAPAPLETLQVSPAPTQPSTGQ